MAYLSKGKKIDLFNLASELRIDVTSNDKIIDLHDKITKSTFFKDNEQFVKDAFNNIVDERKKLEEAEVKKVETEKQRLAEERAFELEKLRLQNHNSTAITANASPIDTGERVLAAADEVVIFIALQFVFVFRPLFWILQVFLVAFFFGGVPVHCGGVIFWIL
ncbi:hypothetical protein AVEN_70384-1 [Araneus ventricosus]|uniref:Uncharacterized protein n=1 Tax=Araneus ventricosus TaxID=182803 RepID=A0A4Y2UXQ5_ARAVE|nr:hypothetical protein AVEN_70384-1 [Araneus ventricosus]